MNQNRSIKKRLIGLTSLIGNTPLLEIQLKYKGKRRLVYAKAEYLNMTGSIKDRMAFYIMEQAYLVPLISQKSYLAVNRRVKGVIYTPFRQIYLNKAYIVSEP